MQPKKKKKKSLQAFPKGGKKSHSHTHNFMYNLGNLITLWKSMVDSLRVYLSQDKNPGHLRSNKVLSTKLRCRLHIRTEGKTVWALSRDSLPTFLKSAICQWLGGKGTGLQITVYQGFSLPVGFQVMLVVKNLRHRRHGSIPGSAKFPGGGRGNPLQYSCLQNPMDRGAWWAIVHEVAESDTTKLTWNACILFVTLLEGTYVNFFS